MQPTLQMTGAPIGVFDSGIGGLSVLRHIRQQSPHENLIYFADSGHAPYGNKPQAVVVARTLAVASFLLGLGCKALVVACNTATAAAIHLLRETYPEIPIVGVEPGLKPAAAATRVSKVGVLATDNTIGSDKFRLLHDQLSASSGIEFILQACTGLADKVENGELDSVSTRDLVQKYVIPLAASGVDTLVLGCTHYPFVQPLIVEAAKMTGNLPMTIIDTGEPVARQLARLLVQHGLANQNAATGNLKAYTTGERSALSQAFEKLLQWSPPVEKIAV